MQHPATPTDEYIAQYFNERQVDNRQPLLVSGAQQYAVVQRLRDAGYQVCCTLVAHSVHNIYWEYRHTSPQHQVTTTQDVLGEQYATLSHTQLGLIEYELAMRARAFIGHSHDTFSALLLLARTGWTSYYNTEDDIPLAQHLPFFKVPWVFTYTSRGSSYDYQVQMAVTSALHVGTLVPFCVYEGNTDTALYRYIGGGTPFRDSYV